jgi:hypothetical protein
VDSVNHRVFTSNVVRLPPCGMPDAESDRSTSERNIRPDQPRFFNEGWPTAPFFVVDSSRFTGGLDSLRFVRLADIEPEAAGMGWRTRHAGYWAALERFLTLCLNSLNNGAVVPETLLPVDDKPLRRRPYESGYLHVVASVDEARLCEFRARRDFIYMLGTLSVFLYGYSAEQSSEQWYRRLMNDSSVTVGNAPFWSKEAALDMLRQSVVNDFTLHAGRVGVFFDCSMPRPAAPRLAFMACTVPVWIYWGNLWTRSDLPPQDSLPASLRRFYPVKANYHAGGYIECDSEPRERRSVPAFSSERGTSALPHTAPPPSGRAPAWTQPGMQIDAPRYAARRKKSNLHPQTGQSLSEYFRDVLLDMEADARMLTSSSSSRADRARRAANWQWVAGDSVVMWNLDNPALRAQPKHLQEFDAIAEFKTAEKWKLRFVPRTSTWHICDHFARPIFNVRLRSGLSTMKAIGPVHDDEYNEYDGDSGEEEDVVVAGAVPRTVLISSADVAALEAYEREGVPDDSGYQASQESPDDMQPSRESWDLVPALQECPRRARHSPPPDRRSESPPRHPRESPPRHRHGPFSDRLPPVGPSASSASTSRRRSASPLARGAHAPISCERSPAVGSSRTFEGSSSAEVGAENFAWTELGLRSVCDRFFWISEATHEPRPDGGGPLDNLRTLCNSVGLNLPSSVPADTQSVAAFLDMQPQTLDKLFAFVAMLAVKVQPVLPRSAFALHPDNGEQLAATLQRSVFTASRIRRPVEWNEKAAVPAVGHKGKPLPHQPRLVRDDWCWVIDQRDDPRRGRDWVVVVHSALAAVWALRASCAEDLDALVLRMVSEGVPFSMPEVPFDPTPDEDALHTHRITASRDILGWRHLEHQFTRSDFLEYEDKRDRCLRQSTRVGRLALLSGGILWRLAVAAVSNRVVLDGPSEYAKATKDALQRLGSNDASEPLGAAFHFGDDEEACEDRLTPVEVELIIGRYHLWKGTAQGLPSYWPTAEHWRGSNWAMLGWHDHAEQWYQDRRKAYLQGKGPEKASAWTTNILRNCARAKDVMRNVRSAANTFMEVHGARLAPDA